MASSVLIVLLVVLLVTHVITPSGESTDFDSVTRRMGFECTSAMIVPPAVKEEGLSSAGAPCQTPAGDILMYLTAYVTVTPGTIDRPGNATSAPPVLTPDIIRWLCDNLRADFLYAAGDNYGLAVRPTTHDSQAYELTDRLGLHPLPHAC